MHKIFNILKSVAILGIWLFATSHCYAICLTENTQNKTKKEHHCCPSEESQGQKLPDNCSNCNLCLKGITKPELKSAIPNSQQILNFSALFKIILNTKNDYVTVRQVTDTNIINYSSIQPRQVSTLVSSPNAPPKLS